MHFQDSGELAGGDLVFCAEGLNGGHRQEGGSREAPRAPRGRCIRVWIDSYRRFEEERMQEEVVLCVAEDVEGFVRVFDSEFADRCISEGVIVDCCVEVGAMTGVLVWGKDQKLGYSHS